MYKGRHILSILLTIALVITMINFVPTKVVYGGVTTPPDGYVGIYDAQDLQDMKDNLSGKYILMNNIDLTAATASGDGWAPVGTKSAPFTGVLDGNGYSITGLRIYKNYLTTTSFVGGLFGYGSGMTVKNLSLTGVFDVSISRATRYLYLGGLVGYGDTLTISGCTVNIKAKGKAETIAMAGLVGYAVAPSGAEAQKTMIQNCVTKGEINTSSRDASVGGLVGKGESLKVVGCTNNMNLYGLVTVTNTLADLGGVVGMGRSYEIQKCTNNGKITGAVSSNGPPTNALVYAAGIIGSADKYDDDPESGYVVIINQCVNNGTVASSQVGSISLGGIAVDLYKASISNCTNNGSIRNVTSKCYGGTAGIIENIHNGSISQCSNNGDILGGQNAAGIVAYNWGNIINSVNYGNVDGAYETGGIFTENESGTIQQCFNSGDISSVQGASVGGIGSSNSGTVQDCYNIGTILGDPAGGIVGSNCLGATIDNCYNIGGVQTTSKLEGGIVGDNNGKISHGYYINSNKNGCGSNTGTNKTTKLTISQLKTQTQYVGFDFVEDDTPAVWQMSPNSDLPCFISQKEVYIKSVAVKRKPLTLTYLLNESVSTTGLCLKVTLSNGRVSYIDDSFVVGSYSKSSGDKDISVSYGGKSTYFTVHYAKIKCEMHDSSTLLVKWMPISGATKIKVYQATKAEGPYTLRTTMDGDSEQIGFELPYGKTYYYKIRPMYGSNAGAISGYASTKMKPNTPTPIAVEIRDEGVFIRWESTFYAEHYELYYSKSMEGPFVKLASTFEYPAYYHKKAVLGNHYYYMVRSYVIEDGVKIYGNFSEVKGTMYLAI